MDEKSNPFTAAMAGFLSRLPWEPLFVVACAAMFLMANCTIRRSYFFTAGSPMHGVPYHTVYGWPARYLETKSMGWLPPDEQVRYKFNWSALMLNAIFTIATGVLGVLAIQFLRHRRFTLLMGGTFVFYACIAAGALQAALSMRWEIF